MVLDAGEEIYVWVGKDSSKEEQDKASAMAEVLFFLLSQINKTNYFACLYFQRYLQTDPTDRNHDAALIIKLHQGEEDKSFTTLFPTWDDKLWEVMLQRLP